MNDILSQSMFVDAKNSTSRSPDCVFKAFSKLIKGRFQRDALKFGYKTDTVIDRESQKTYWAA